MVFLFDIFFLIFFSVYSMGNKSAKEAIIKAKEADVIELDLRLYFCFFLKKNKS